MSKGLKMLAINRSRQGGGQGGQGVQNEMRNEMRGGYGGMESNRGGRMRNEMEMGYGGMENEMRGEARSEMEMGGAEMRRRYSRDRRGRFTGEMENEMEMRGEMENRGRQYRSGQSNTEGYSDYTPNSYARSNDPGAEMESGRWLPPYYDVDINRYESRSRDGEGDRGSGNRMTRNDPSSREGGGNMRMIGFGREIYNNDMRSDASMPKFREGDRMAGEKMKKGGAKSEMGMDEHTAREWTSKMENEDGSTGPHWTMEQIKKVMEQRSMTGDPVEFWVAMNMMYSDYCKVAKKLGVNSVDFYAEMAKAFLEDKDAGASDKLMAYYENVVKG